MQPVATHIHLTPEDYDVIGEERFGVPGLVAVESVGPGMPVKRIGPLFIIHDSVFEARHGIPHHPHQGMERLFYILSGAVDHDDARNGITGHMSEGDLGILTEGSGGMLHSETNPTDGRTRCWILVYPCEPMPETASFAAIRDRDMPRTQGHSWRGKHVVQPGDPRLHGDLRLFADFQLEPNASMDFALNPEEAGVLFVVRGALEVTVDGVPDPLTAAETHTLLWPPGAHARKIELRAHGPARYLHLVTGPGEGLVHA